MLTICVEWPDGVDKHQRHPPLHGEPCPHGAPYPVVVGHGAVLEEIWTHGPDDEVVRVIVLGDVSPLGVWIEPSEGDR